ncbi:hypothetical protein T09_11967 [Trichinella sp. T9]|nr:hypothetical protein T09_11967 [Trichinella sp. T9]
MLMTPDKHAYLFSPCSHPHSFFPSLFTCFARRKFSSFALFVAFVMSVVPEIRFVQNRCGGTSLVYEGRAYKLKRAARKKYWRCSQDKKGCGGAVWTNLDVTTGGFDKAEETKPNPAIYDEEASAASAQPSTSGYFPLFRRVRAAMYGHRAKRFPKLPNHRRDLQIPVPFRTTKTALEKL